MYIRTMGFVIKERLTIFFLILVILVFGFGVATLLYTHNNYCAQQEYLTNNLHVTNVTDHLISHAFISIIGLLDIADLAIPSVRVARTIAEVFYTMLRVVNERAKLNVQTVRINMTQCILNTEFKVKAVNVVNLRLTEFASSDFIAFMNQLTPTFTTNIINLPGQSYTLYDIVQAADGHILSLVMNMPIVQQAFAAVNQTIVNVQLHINSMLNDTLNLEF